MADQFVAMGCVCPSVEFERDETNDPAQCDKWPNVNRFDTFVEKFEKPQKDNQKDGKPLVLGTRFLSIESVNVTAIRWYKPAHEGKAEHTVTIFDAHSGKALVSRTAIDRCTDGEWVSVELDRPFCTAANAEYIVAVDHLHAYAKDEGFFETPRDVGSLSAVGGVWGHALGEMPTNHNDAFYWIDRKLLGLSWLHLVSLPEWRSRSSQY